MVCVSLLCSCCRYYKIRYNLLQNLKDFASCNLGGLTGKFWFDQGDWQAYGCILTSTLATGGLQFQVHKSTLCVEENHYG